MEFGFVDVGEVGGGDVVVVVEDGEFDWGSERHFAAVILWRSLVDRIRMLWNGMRLWVRVYPITFFYVRCSCPAFGRSEVDEGYGVVLKSTARRSMVTSLVSRGVVHESNALL